MLVLASNSPRRHELLALGGWSFQVAPANVDETALPDESPAAYVQRVALAKGQAVLPHTAPGVVVVAADTTVADGLQILGKPADKKEALRMLHQLRGRTHQVFTALAILRHSTLPLVDLCETLVPMRNYSDLEMETYISSGDPFDKAGAYAIQHPGFRPVPILDGCYANVVGLPLCHLLRTLRQTGAYDHADLPAACQAALRYRCAVYQQFLSA
jgi:MAF protein